MNLDIRDVKQVSIAFYLAEVFILISLAIFRQNFPTGIKYFFIIYGILSIFLFLYLGGKIMEKHPLKCRCALSWLFILVTVFACYLLGNFKLMFCTFFAQQICFLLYMDKRIVKIQVAEILLTVFILYVLGCMGYTTYYHPLEYLNFVACLLGVHWILLKLIEAITFRTRQSFEQEQSLDDLLKVVEAKCDEARIATKTKSNFLSSMSHEIRTPINAILGMNEMILRESKEENIMEYASNIESSGRMLLAIINDILDLSKIESGKMELLPIQYSLESLITDCINMAKNKATQKGLSFQMEVNPHIPVGLFGDEIRIKQVLTNLLTNAIKYTEKGSILLKVDYKPVDIYNILLRLSVTDTGKGIHEKDKEKLFETFQRIDEKRNRTIEGTGLGLPIAKSFVDMMQGTMTVDSTYGLGSTFYIEIPQKIMDSTPIGNMKDTFEKKASYRKPYQESFQAPSAKILVVDDNNMNLAVIQQLLKQTKIQITLATSGKECLKLTKQEAFDLILLDHMMPEMDGIETLNAIRQDPDNLCFSIPIIALTANAISGVINMYLDVGFQDYMSKPITGTILEDTLLTHLPKEKILLKDATGQYFLPQTAHTSNSQIDTMLGLSFCGNEESIYREVLQLFCNMKKEQIAFLNCAFEHNDWKHYTAQLYELKSNTLNIGAKNMSEFVKKLEFSGRSVLMNDSQEKHIAFLQSNHQKLIQDLEEVTTEGLHILEAYS